MKKIITALIGLLIWYPTLHSQTSMDKILEEIERNNTTLAALRKNLEAEKIGNKTGLAFQNPEFEFHYLWGKPGSIGNRTDISIRQNLDFPSAYSFKNQIAKAKNSQLEVEFQRQRKLVLLQSKLILIDIVHANLLQGIYDKRLTNAQTLANAYQEKLKNGEANILELNKARLNLLNIRKEAEKNTIDRNGLLSQLAGNNNGIMVDFADTVFLHAEIPAEFEKWYADTAQYFPDLEIIKREIETSRKQEQLYLALGLPRLTAGYMSENIPGNQFQGVIAGISVPLWEKRNTVKQAKARTVALQGAETDFRVKVYNQLKTAHSKIIALQKTVDDYRSTLGSYDNAKFLDKALAKGEINLIDYIQELSFYYRSVDELLATENELNRSVAELYQFME